MANFIPSGGATSVVLSFGAGDDGVGFDYADSLRTRLCHALNCSTSSEQVYMDYYALQNKPGTAASQKTLSNGKVVTSYLNDNWREYYQSALRSCNVFLIIVDQAWCDKWGKEEWKKTAEFARKNAATGFRFPMIIQRDDSPDTVDWISEFKSMSNPSPPHGPLFLNGTIPTPFGTVHCMFKQGQEEQLINNVKMAVGISKQMNGMMQNPMMMMMQNPMMMNPGMMMGPPCTIQ